MFGVVPWAIWSKLAPPDEEGRILLATRSLVISDGDRKMVVDLGCGDKWSEKSRAIFCIPEGAYRPVPGVTDVLLTHLHFDHGGGVSRFVEEASGRAAHDSGSDLQKMGSHGGEYAEVGSSGTPIPNPSPSPGTNHPGQGEVGLEPCYPSARHYVSRANYENAKDPNVRERASYLAENVDALGMVDLVLTSDGDEVWPGVTVHQVDGHTHGLQWVRVSDGSETVVFPADLFPTSKHLPLAYVMGYDMCAQTSLREREAFLRDAVEGNWVVVFEHDPVVGAARLRFDERGRPVVAEEVAL